jgi:hypothetical protein
VAVARLGKGRRACRWLKLNAKPGLATFCSRPFWLLARCARDTWSLTVRGRLSPGRYRVLVRAIDSTGRTQVRPARRTVVIRRAARRRADAPRPSKVTIIPRFPATSG